MTATIKTEARAELIERWIVREAYSNLLISLFVGRDAIMADPMPEAHAFTTGFEAGTEGALEDLTEPMADALWPLQNGRFEGNPEFGMANLRAQLLTTRMFAALAGLGSSRLACGAAEEAAMAETMAIKIAAKGSQPGEAAA